MSKLIFRGDKYVIADISKSDKYKPEAEIACIRRKIEFLSKVRSIQKFRAQSDIEYFNSVIARIEKGEKLGVFQRQYAGHRFIPDKVDNKYPIVWVGSYVMWK